jgi:hypothetical protein
MTRLGLIRQCLSNNLVLWLSLTVAFAVFYYLLLMAALIIRFESLPNYLNAYDWNFNIRRIWLSTPSLLDSVTIMKDEWLFEVGFMNYDYGKGISEWSLFIAPFKVLGVLLLTAAVSSMAAGLGTTLVSLASITMSWVVCCSTPTWVVGLAMMGLGVSTSLWLEPIGIWVNILGYFFLIVAIYIAASHGTTET